MVILFLYLAAFLLFFCFLRPNKEKTIMNRSFTDGAKGLFILLIVLSHMLNAFPYDGFLSGPLSFFRSAMGQICVTPFFLISGYGLFEGYKKYGDSYNKRVLTKHLLEFYIITLICLVPYFVIDFVNNGSLRSIGDYALFLVGLKSLGNQNWFIFAILFCYLITFLSGLLKPNKWIRFSLILACCAIYYVMFAFVLKQPVYWYNTLVAFPVGCLFSIFSEHINSKLSTKKSIIGIVISLLLYCGFGILAVKHFSDLIKNICFSFGFVFASYLFKSNNKFIIYFGINSWSLFMLHMIPINKLSKFGFNVNITYILSISVSLLLCFLFSTIKKLVVSKLLK